MSIGSSLALIDLEPKGGESSYFADRSPKRDFTESKDSGRSVSSRSRGLAVSVPDRDLFFCDCRGVAGAGVNADALYPRGAIVTRAFRAARLSYRGIMPP